MIDDNGSIQCRRYPHGKVVINSKGNRDYASMAEAALIKSVKLVPQFDQSLFTQYMKEQGVPESDITTFIENISIDNGLSAENTPDLEIMHGITTSISISQSKQLVP